MKKTKKTKIESEKWYKLIDIVKMNIFPWLKGIKCVRDWVNRDQKGKNKLKAMITGEGTQKRYFIKGSNILEFIKSCEDGKYLK